MSRPFRSLYSHGFIRAAVCVPHVRVADPDHNVERMLDLARQASKKNVALTLFPELGISAYSNDDLFHQDALLEASEAAVERLVGASRDLTPFIVAGAPLRFNGQLFNCAVAIYKGRILGVTPKTYLPNYREFYEGRQFTSSRDAIAREVELLGHTVPLGNDLVYDAVNVNNFSVHAEICEDVWVPIPPSTYAALGGATVLVNLSASNITIGKASYRKSLCASHSA
jgi:NAD+ synthase (glutamine-hydrolysing)